MSVFACIKSNNFQELVHLVKEKGAKCDETVRDNNGRTCTMLAALNGQVDALRCLVEQGGKCDETVRDNNGMTCTMVAAVAGQVATLRFLQEQGAKCDETVRDDNGMTCVMLAAFAGHLTVVRSLVDEMHVKCDESITDKKYCTTLDWAKRALGNRNEIVSYLEGKIFPEKDMDEEHQSTSTDQSDHQSSEISHILVFSSNGDNNWEMWDIFSGKCLKKFEGHIDTVLDVCYSPDNPQLCVSASLDMTCKLWDLSSGKCLRTYCGHLHAVNSVSFINPEQFITTSFDKTCRLWDISTDTCVRTFEGHTHIVRSITVNPNNSRQFFSVSNDQTYRLWDMDTGLLQKFHLNKSDIPPKLVISLAPNQVLTASLSCSLWDSSKGKHIQTYNGHTGLVSCVILLTDGLFLTSSHDNTCKLWEISSGKCIRTFEGHTNWVKIIDLYPSNANQFISISIDKTFKIWDIYTGECVKTGMLPANMGRAFFNIILV